MSMDWVLNLLSGGRLIDKAIDLAIAEENADLIASKLGDVIYASRFNISSPISSEERDVGSPKTNWGSKKIEYEDKRVRGSLEVLNEEYKAGVIVDAFIVSDSSDFGITLTVDGRDFYDNTYDEFISRTKSDTMLSAYQDASTNKYLVAIHNIYFIERVKFVLKANNLTFDLIRINYNTENIV